MLPRMPGRGLAVVLRNEYARNKSPDLEGFHNSGSIAGGELARGADPAYNSVYGNRIRQRAPFQAVDWQASRLPGANHNTSIH